MLQSKERKQSFALNEQSVSHTVSLLVRQTRQSLIKLFLQFFVVVLIGWGCSGDWQVGILCSALYTRFTLLILPLPVFSLYPCSHLIIGERSFPCSALSAGDTFPYKIWSFSTLSSFKSLNLGGFLILKLCSTDVHQCCWPVSWYAGKREYTYNASVFWMFIVYTCD